MNYIRKTSELEHSVIKMAHRVTFSPGLVNRDVCSIYAESSGPTSAGAYTPDSLRWSNIEYWAASFHSRRQPANGT